jgi:hypothetical protein
MTPSGITSINHGINPDAFPTAWGSFDAMAALILLLPAGCVAATFDISAAYRLTPIRPDQQHHLCILWEGLVYVDWAVIFGLASRTGVFGAIADMLVALYKAAGFSRILKWVDDFFVIRLPNKDWTEQDFMALTATFGVPWSAKKMRPLSTVQCYIGFDWNLKAHTVALPHKKLTKILQAMNCCRAL